MEIFEPILVDDKINQAILKILSRDTSTSFEFSKINNYAYFFKNLKAFPGKTTRYYIYVLHNEFTQDLYIGVTLNIKTQLKDHEYDTHIGNENTFLNGLFILDLEDILKGEKMFSSLEQATFLTHKLIKNMRSSGYEISHSLGKITHTKKSSYGKTQYANDLDYKYVRQTIKEESPFIRMLLNQYIRIHESGYYLYYSLIESGGDGEVYHEMSKEEIDSSRNDVEKCKDLLKRHDFNFNKTELQFIMKCLEHRGLMISTWELGFRSVYDFTIFNTNKNHFRDSDDTDTHCVVHPDDDF